LLLLLVVVVVVVEALCGQAEQLGCGVQVVER